MSKRDHLRISWDYDSAFSKWIYENSINNDLLTKNKLIIALYDNNKKIKTFFGVDIYPLRRHPDNEVRLNTLYTSNFSLQLVASVDKIKLQEEYDTVRKYLRTYGVSDYYYHDRVSVERISEDILHFKFLKSSPPSSHGSRVVRSSIYILNFSQFKNGYISFYLNSINKNSHLFSKNFDELKSLSHIKFLNVSGIEKISSDPKDCEYEWSVDSRCYTENNETDGFHREIVRITKLSEDGGVPCNVATYGVVRDVPCKRQKAQKAGDPIRADSQPAPAPAPPRPRNYIPDPAERAQTERTRICRIGCQTLNGDYWCESSGDPDVNDCDKFTL